MKITTKDFFRIIRDYARPWLTGSRGTSSAFYNSIPEIYPVLTSRSENERVRFNILLPTAKPEKIYGGVATALKIASQMISGLPPDCDIRVIITSDSVGRESVTEISKRLGKTFIINKPNEDVTGFSVTDLYEWKFVPMSIRENDIYFTTAWWTANLGFRLQDSQKLMFGNSYDLVYLIQDFEPGFYAWSNHYALSEATYRKGQKTLALINSEELFNFMAAKYKFKNLFVIPYTINEDIADAIKVCPKEKILLVYGRPTVARNCFETIVEALRLWQLSAPSINTKYEIKFVGEYFSDTLIAELENALVLGKLPLSEYADLLSRAAIGVSLMVSPHPSYPPLEMSFAGCITITNCYENKNLSLNNDNILSIEELSPERLALELERATLRFESASRAIAKPVKGSSALSPNYHEICQKILASAS